MILFAILSGMFVLFLYWLLYHWVDSPSVREASHTGTFTVLLPVRNEKANIQALLSDLLVQQFPPGQWEVIVIDDSSEDNTLARVREMEAAFAGRLRVLLLADTGLTGKKAAITLGVAQAKFDRIVTVDGDCRVGQGWLASYAAAYSLSGAKMITGPVCMTGTRFFHQIQAYEFAALVGFGAASLHAKRPATCNGANLSYEREAFQAVNGYEGNRNVPSGDDEFLLQKIAKTYPGDIFFNKTKEAVVRTPAKDTLAELVNQRVRWSGKWKHHRQWTIPVAAVLFFLHYAAMIWAGVQAATDLKDLVWFAGILSIRWFTTLIFVSMVSRLLGQKRLFWASVAGEIIYPFFVIFLGFASIFGKYSWKGRRYK